MADTPAPSTAAPTPADQSAGAAAVFDKFVSQHAAAVAAELGGHNANAQNGGRPAAARPARVGAPAAGAAADAAGVRARGADAGAERGDGPGGERRGSEAADDASAAASGEGDAAGPEAGGADGAPAAEAPAPLTEAAAIELARKAHAEGDTDALDRALKAILPGSKGLAEFTVDGKRYGELRAVTNKERKKLDARAAEIDTRETNVRRGLAMVEELVARYEPIEKLVRAAESDDVDAFVTLIETATKKPLNDTIKRHLDKKLGKPGDPEVEALKRELRATNDKLAAREKAEQEAREHQARTREIQGHLAFLDETLSAHADPRVVALVKTNEGLREIFLAQKAAYDPRTRSTITPERAALQVIEAKAKELEPWQRVLAPKALPAAGSTIVEAKGEPIPSATPRATPLGSRGGAAASGSGSRQLSDQELFDKYERLAKLAGD